MPEIKLPVRVEADRYGCVIWDGEGNLVADCRRLESAHPKVFAIAIASALNAVGEMREVLGKQNQWLDRILRDRREADKVYAQCVSAKQSLAAWLAPVEVPGGGR